MMRKKKYKFQVNLMIEELSSVPFVNAMLFTKLRLLDGGSFENFSERRGVTNHSVRWDSRFTFCCKMALNPNTGELETCLLRVSVRKETKGGKSHQKLGYADVNLAEYAGSGNVSRRYLLEGYDSKHRQDNSILKLCINMILLSGDPLFKKPRVHEIVLPGEAMVDEQLEADNKGDDSSGTGSGSGSCRSNGAKARPTVISADAMANIDGPHAGRQDMEFIASHSRNSSYNSQRSAGYSSIHTHSRQSSLGSEATHCRKVSDGSSALSDFTGSMERKPERRRLQLTSEETSRRVDATRVNADDLIEQMLKESNLEADDSAETSGLKLFVLKDGTTALGGTELQAKMNATKFQQVVIDCKHSR